MTLVIVIRIVATFFDYIHLRQKLLLVNFAKKRFLSTFNLHQHIITVHIGKQPLAV